MIGLIKYIKDRDATITSLYCNPGTTLGLCNPSILKFDGKHYMTFRSCEYTFICYPHDYDNSLTNCGMTWFPYHKFKEVPTNYLSTNYLAEFDNESNLVKIIKKLEPNPETREYFYNGAEDMRLFEHDAHMHVSYSKCDGDKISMNIARINGDLSVTNIAKYSDKDKYEKNWMPICDGSNRFVRKAFENIVTLECNEHETVFRNSGNPDMDIYRYGSTQIIPYNENYYICLVHKKIRSEHIGLSLIQYIHMFVILDKDMKPVKESEWFTFMGFPIEFTCGMHIENDVMLLPFSVWDSASFIIKMKMEDVFKFINGDYHGNLDIGIPDLKFYSKHLLTTFDWNYAIRIASNSFLGAIEQDKEKAIDHYLNVLCDVTEFKTKMDNSYMHMLIGEDMVTDIIKKLK